MAQLSAVSHANQTTKTHILLSITAFTLENALDCAGQPSSVEQFIFSHPKGFMEILKMNKHKIDICEPLGIMVP